MSPLGCGIAVAVQHHFGVWGCCGLIQVSYCCLYFALLSVLGFVVDDVVTALRNNAAAELFQRVHQLLPFSLINCCALKSLSPNLFFASTLAYFLYRFL